MRQPAIHHRPEKAIVRFGLTVTTALLAMALVTKLAAMAADAKLVGAAKKGGQLVAYGDPTYLPLLVAGSSTAYPDVKVISDSVAGSQTYYRYLSKKQAGRPIADIIYTGEDAMLIGSDDGNLQEYRPTAVADMPDWAASPAGNYVLVNAARCVLLYNETATRGLPIRKGWIDCANPPQKWQNPAILSDPRNLSAAYNVVATLYQHYGPERAGLTFEGLRKAGAELSPNTGPQTAKLISGERPMITTINTGYLATMLDDGAPTKMVVPASGAIPVFGGLGIAKNAPHPNAARLLMECSLGPEGQAIVTSQVAYSVRNGAAAPARLPSYSKVKIMKMDLRAALREPKDILAWWQSKLGVN